MLAAPDFHLRLACRLRRRRRSGRSSTPCTHVGSAFHPERAGRAAAVRSMPSRSHEKCCAGLRHRVGLGVPTRVRRTISRSSVFPACGAGRRWPACSGWNFRIRSNAALRRGHGASAKRRAGPARAWRRREGPPQGSGSPLPVRSGRKPTSNPWRGMLR